MPRTVETEDAPAAVGAYSQATTSGGLVFTAGQLPLTVDGDLLDDHSVPDQTRQCLQNVEAILAAEGLGREAILKTTVFLGDLDDFEAFNEAYGEFFGDLDAPPARSAVEVGAVPKGAALEIEAVAASD